MSEQSNIDGGENKWRDKYLDTVDRQEKQEAQFKEQQKLLQRAMLRVSLAAEGQYADLDVALETLREHLRSDELVDLGESLAQLDEILKSFEKDREQGSQDSRQALEQIIGPLLQRDIPRDAKKQLNEFTREYARRREQIQDYPEILKHIARLQNLVLIELAEPNEKGGGGLFSGLFGSDKTVQKDETEAEIDDEDASEDEAELPLKSDRALFELNPNAAVKDSQTVSAQLRSIINALLQSVEAQAVSPERVKNIQSKLKKGITNADLIPVLDEVCQLVMAAYVAATGAFVSYLNTVNQDLVDIFKAVGGAETREEVYKDASELMQNNMMEQFLDLESETAAATDLSELKTQVQSRIDHIRLALEQYQQTVAHDDTDAMQLSELAERIKVMEQEAQKNHKMLQQQRFKAMHDPLTKLPNREAFNERISLESKRWKRYGNPLTLAICDLDHFKKINDTLGHQAGDRVLQVISQAVGKRLRDVDFFGRYGGEEFIVILPDTSAENAMTLLDKLRAAIANTEFSYKDTPVSISMSIGLSEFQGEDTASAVLQRADAALYVAKDSGRNKCSLG